MADIIKAIETRYNGHRFRSRTEARWAVLFDHLGVEYHYEAEGYELSDGTRYLPDFYMPKEDCFFEIKGDVIADDAWLKPALLAAASKRDVYVLVGRPGQHEVTVFRPRRGAVKPEVAMQWIDSAPSAFFSDMAEHAVESSWSWQALKPWPAQVDGLRLGRTYCALDYCAYTRRLAEWLVEVFAEGGTRYVDERTGAWSLGYSMATYTSWRPIGLGDELHALRDQIGFIDPGVEHDSVVISDRFQEAIAAARSARFEFGESGAG